MPRSVVRPGSASFHFNVLLSHRGPGGTGILCSLLLIRCLLERAPSLRPLLSLYYPQPSLCHSAESSSPALPMQDSKSLRNSFSSGLLISCSGGGCKEPATTASNPFASEGVIFRALQYKKLSLDRPGFLGECPQPSGETRGFSVPPSSQRVVRLQEQGKVHRSLLLRF